VQGLASYFKPFTPATNRFTGKAGGSSSGGADDVNLGEYAALMEEENFDFVLYTIPQVDVRA
jgi:hypothetical protein